MKHIKLTFLKLVALMCIVNIVLSAPIFTYDPSAGSTITINALPGGLRDNDIQNLNWFRNLGLAGGNTGYEFTKYNPAAVNNINKYALDTGAATAGLGALSQDLTCAIVFDDATTPAVANVYKFDTNPVGASLGDLIALSKLTTGAPALAATLQVSSNCAAVRVLDGAVDGVFRGTSFGTADTLVTGPTAWTNPVFNRDFSYVIADNGIYKQTAGTWTQALALTGAAAPLANYKKIWTMGTNIVVFSYQTTGNTYKVSIYTGATPAQAAISWNGVFFASTTPTIRVSQTLRTIVVYGNTAAAAYFYTGKVIDFTPATPTAVSITFPADISGVENYITLTDAYLYARNGASVAAASRVHLGYYVNGGALSKLFGEVIPAAISGATWTKSFIKVDASNNFRVLSQFIASSADKTVTLEQTIVSVPGLLQEWDRTAGQSMGYTTKGSITITASSVTQIWGKMNWFRFAVSSTDPTKYILSLTYVDEMLNKPVNEIQLTSTGSTFDLTSSATRSLKKLSKNGQCAIIYDMKAGADSTLSVYNFMPAMGMTVLATMRDIKPLIVSGMPTTWEISNDCNALRLDNKVYHWDAMIMTPAYVLDTTDPVSLVMSDLMFTSDLAYGFTQTGLYSYTPKSSTAASGLYKLHRADTYYATGSIWSVGYGLVIFGYEEVVATPGIFNWKVQINALVSQVWTKIEQLTGVSKGVPKYAISQKLTNIVVSGINSTDSTTPYYFARSVDYLLLTSKAFTLPTVITSANNEILVNQYFLYARNTAGAARSHYAYAIFGATLTEAVNQVLDYSLIYNYKRSALINNPDGKFTLVSQYDMGNPITWTRLIKDQRKTVGEYISTRVPPAAQFTFDYSTLGAVFKKSGFENDIQKWMMKWIYLNVATTTLSEVLYDPTVAATRKTTIDSAVILPTTILAVSSSGDCVLTKTASQVNVYSITTTGTPAITLVENVLTNGINAEYVNIGAVDAVIASSFSVANACWAIKIENNVYTKTAPAGVTAYAKNAAASAWVGAVFDANFKFAYDSSSTTLFKYDGSTYTSIATGLTGLKTISQLWASPDLNTVLMLSYTQSAGPTYDFVVKSWTFSATWIMNTIDSGLATGSVPYSFVPFVKASQNFQSVIVFYRLTTMGNQGMATLKRLYPNGTVTAYPLPSQFSMKYTASLVSLTNDYVHLVAASQVVGGVSQEIFYSNNRASATLTQISRRPVSSDYLNTKLIYFKLELIGTDLFASYAYDDVTNKVITIQKNKVPNTAGSAILGGIQGAQSGLVLVNDVPFLCQEGCLSCSVQTNCLVCSNGWFLQPFSNRCYPCSAQCKTCSGFAALSVCTSCYEGLYIFNGKCKQCHDSCLTCSGSGPVACTSCKISSYLESASCISCPNNCLQCTNLMCTKCIIGYVFNTAMNKCIRCTTACINCNPVSPSQCLSCVDGFRTVMAIDGVTVSSCQKCSVSGCKECATSSSTCTACRDGYRLSSNQCVQLCKLPCLTCSDSDPTQCNSCIGGYTFASNMCSPVLTCNTGPSCTVCPLGYNLVNSKCQKCNGGSKCSTCSTFSIDQCAKCTAGNYLNSTLRCNPCSSGCGQCDNEVFCKKCNPGYVLSGTNAGSKCLRCDRSCQSCTITPQNCQTCAKGYLRSGWVCVNQNRLKTVWKLASVFASFTTLNYQTVIEDICSYLNISTSNFVVEGLESGSVVLTGSVQFTNTLDLASLVAAVQSANTAGAVGGFTIQSVGSTIVTDAALNTASNEDAAYYKNVAIIVGVVIPIALIVIFIVLLALMKKGVIGATTGGAKIGDVTLEDIEPGMHKENEFSAVKNGQGVSQAKLK